MMQCDIEMSQCKWNIYRGKCIIMLPFEDFSNIYISGISGSGKTQYLHKLCKHAKVMFYPTGITKIIYVYRHFQDSFRDLINETDNDITFTTEVPNEEQLTELVKDSAHTLLIFDDCLQMLQSNPICQDLCVRLSHHLRMSVVFSAQTASLKGKYGPDIVKNIHANVVLRSPKEVHYIKSLGIMMGKYALLRQAYDMATQKPYSYISIVNHPRRHSHFQIASNIFPDEEPTYVYINKEAE